jgi:hypothetical protein
MRVSPAGCSIGYQEIKRKELKLDVTRNLGKHCFWGLVGRDNLE